MTCRAVVRRRAGGVGGWLIGLLSARTARRYPSIWAFGGRVGRPVQAESPAATADNRVVSSTDFDNVGAVYSQLEGGSGALRPFSGWIESNAVQVGVGLGVGDGVMLSLPVQLLNPLNRVSA